MSARKQAEAPPGSVLWINIAERRGKGYPTLTDGQYMHLLSRIAERFPGMDLQACWPFDDGESSLRFTWDGASLIAARILEPSDIPPGRKRLHYRDGLQVRLVRGGRLEVFARICSRREQPSRSWLLHIDPTHPLAMFLPSVVQAIKSIDRLRPPPWLRLVVDNTRVRQ